MIITAGIEDSGVVDSGETGKKIGISTTARIAYRQSFGDLAKQRNHIVNEFIAKAFAGGIMVEFFKPKQTGIGEIGQIREVGGAKFIAVISDEAVRVIAVKGSAPQPTTLPSLQSEEDTASFDGAKDDMERAQSALSN